MIKQWVKDMVEETMGMNKLHIGAVVKHPDGRTVKITDGQYWGTYGWSNFWYWKEVKENGRLGRQEHGYGWM